MKANSRAGILLARLVDKAITNPHDNAADFYDHAKYRTAFGRLSRENFRKAFDYALRKKYGTDAFRKDRNQDSKGIYCCPSIDNH